MAKKGKQQRQEKRKKLDL